MISIGPTTGTDDSNLGPMVRTPTGLVDCYSGSEAIFLFSLSLEIFFSLSFILGVG